VKRILILGGYGGFGARLSRRLAQQGHHILVGGRRIAAASAFCETLANTQPILADREGDIAALLHDHRPDLVIDAAGPFQDSDFGVPAACIAAGIPYLDLADGRAFVTGIGALDEDAKNAGVAIIAGASSVPALSGAVIRTLAADLSAVTAIDMSISASNRATAGPSVASAILSYVGKPVQLWRGHWVAATGWQLLRRQRFDCGQGESVTRLVALADVPDHQIVPNAVPGKPAVTFRAGPEFAFQTLALWLLSWPVRWGWITALTPLSNVLRIGQGLTARLGSDRSAMAVEVKGFDGRGALQRVWTLIAENGDGPEIPTMAAALLADMILDQRLAPGARNASAVLTLDQFSPLFAALSIRHHVTETRVPPVYARVMGKRFGMLPPAVRTMHEVNGHSSAHGEAIVTRGRNPVARLVALIMRFPPEGAQMLHVSFDERDGKERWTRDFAGHCFSSVLTEKNGMLVERFGPMRFRFDLPTTPHGLTMIMRGWTLFGIPLPLALAPRTRGTEWQDDGDGAFCFDVPIALPLIGMVVHYRGRLWRN
jgi:hypothetical protein